MPNLTLLVLFPPTALKSLAIAQAMSVFFALYEKKITAHFKIVYLFLKPYERQGTMPCEIRPIAVDTPQNAFREMSFYKVISLYD